MPYFQSMKIYHKWGIFLPQKSFPCCWQQKFLNCNLKRFKIMKVQPDIDFCISYDRSFIRSFVRWFACLESDGCRSYWLILTWNPLTPVDDNAKRPRLIWETSKLFNLPRKVADTWNRSSQVENIQIADSFYCKKNSKLRFSATNAVADHRKYDDYCHVILQTNKM